MSKDKFTHHAANPITKLTRIVKIAEKIAFTSSAVLVLGTLGWISFHVLA